MRLVREHREAVTTKVRGHPAYLVDMVDNHSILVSSQFLQERTYNPASTGWNVINRSGNMGISTCVFSCANTVHSKSSEATHSTSLIDYPVL